MPKKLALLLLLSSSGSGVHGQQDNIGINGNCGTFTCPPEVSVPKADGRCIWSIWDCDCNEGYEVDMTRNSCKVDTGCDSTYRCPPNSAPQVDCAWGLWDCACEEGFQRDWDAGTCETASWSYCGNFICPDHAAPQPDGRCVWSIWDCLCEEGYERDGDLNACVLSESSTEGGNTKCWSDYVCPKNSSPSPNANECPWSKWDCECNAGYIFDWNTEACALVPGTTAAPSAAASATAVPVSAMPVSPEPTTAAPSTAAPSPAALSTASPTDAPTPVDPGSCSEDVVVRINAPGESGK